METDIIENIERYNLPIEGMTCASCVLRVEKALGKVEGVKNVSVNLATEKAVIDLEAGKTDLNKLKEVVEEAGYKITLPAATAGSNSKNEEDIIKDEFSENLKKNFLISLIFTIPVFIISMSMEFSWFHKVIPVSMEYINKILLLLTTPIIFIPGKRFFSVFWKNLKHFTADMNTLVSIGTGSAYIYSVTVVLFPGLISAAGYPAHVYFDSAAVIITLILLGRWLENKAKRKTGAAIKKLLELKPKTVLIKKDNHEEIINIEDIALNDIVIIKPGEKIPADGKIISGYSAVNESIITGESIPVDKITGDSVIGGSININGAFEFQVTAAGDNSILGKIIKFVEEAQGSKAPIQKLADKIASVFVPIVIGIAIVSFLYWIIFGSSFEPALINFIAVLIIACPCALGLATPTAIMAGTGKGASLGILIKNGESLELIHKISAIVLDKTGTITEGKPAVTDVININISREDLLTITASVESRSEHPVARAILEFAGKEKIKYSVPDKLTNLPGHGIHSVFNGKEVIIGNEQLMDNFSVSIKPLENEYTRLSEEGKTVLFVAVNNIFEGIIAVADQIKSNSAQAISDLKKMGLKVIMLTGDNEKTAHYIAKKAGIDKYYAGILPEHKAAIIKELQSKNEIVAMVGDGINDAPALAVSNIGVSMGSGTDVAIESSDITILKKDLGGVVDSIILSKRIIRTIKQNFFWAFIYNILGIPLAALGLLNPMFAALAMSFSSVSVVSNSLRLNRTKMKH